ncbi:transcriptional activator NhaR [Ferrimonas lipolytica]|uniref:Transcriptional activator protein NhaR n=1 Tax=Ferrimonas lipolytica TaxID=2724191 RepID=A0A6H1UFA7_9GAMM|nr:transcriptional activator NhaR [Ferrimonas lipolytica]QIZ77508.1 transcriptional activator NhaR [Ferrimonas lipolytica]
MAHLNYNHLYYFWMVQKKGSVVAAAQALFLAPQTVTGQIRQLEQRLGGKLFDRKGRQLQPTQLGLLVYRYADQMFNLAYEMQDLLNYTKDESILFEVGIAETLSKPLASRVLLSVMPADGSIHLNCFQAADDQLAARLDQHKLDMILSGSDAESRNYSTILSQKLGSCGICFFSQKTIDGEFPANLEQAAMLIPQRKSPLGQQLLRWFDGLGLTPKILGEFDDAAMMKAFGRHSHGIFVTPNLQKQEMLDAGLTLIGETEEVQEEYHVMFAERMIQHPAVRRLLSTDFGPFFAGNE